MRDPLAEASFGGAPEDIEAAVVYVGGVKKLRGKGKGRGTKQKEEDE